MDRGCLGNHRACVAVPCGGAVWEGCELLAGEHLLLATCTRRGGRM